MHILKTLISTLLAIKTATYAFPISPHVDLLRVGIIKMKSGDVYKVLKPVKHRIEDHFSDIMLRRDTQHYENQKVFMDKNGIRHFWSEISDKNSHYVHNRKSNKDEKTEKQNSKTKDIGNEDTTTDGTDYNTEANTEGDKEQPTDDEETATENNETEPPESTTRDVTETDNLDVTTKAALRNGKERTIVHTTFFCPFFGIIKMSRYLD